MNDIKPSTSYNEISDKGAVSDQVSGQIMNKVYTSRICKALIRKVFFLCNDHFTFQKPLSKAIVQREKVKENDSDGPEKHLHDPEFQSVSRVSQLRQWEAELQKREQAIKKRQQQAELELNRERSSSIKTQGCDEKMPAMNAPRSSQCSNGPSDMLKTLEIGSHHDHLCDWTEYWDAATNQKFYFHKDTRHVAWRTPPRKLSDDEYSYLTDGDLSNTSNWESTFDVDFYEFLNYECSELATSTMSTVESTAKVHTTVNKDDSMTDFAHNSSESSSNELILDSNWEQLFDDRYGEFYWYNSSTGVSQWEDPQIDEIQKKS
jgi:hypothetical protein